VHWLDLEDSARELDQLVILEDGHAAALLRTFEPGESLLHAYLKGPPPTETQQANDGLEDAAGATLSVEYPRFDLVFDLERGQLRTTSSFLGTRLAPCQLLPDALLGFQQYLLLEHDDGVNVTVLVPEGAVGKDGDGVVCVTVNGDPGCDVDRRFHAYAVHSRFKMLQASTLQLGPLGLIRSRHSQATRPSVERLGGTV